MTAVFELERESGAAPKPRDDGSSTSHAVSPAPESERAEAARDELSSTPSEEQLLDVLYEVLAQGVPARGSLTRPEVERFLHEHARNRKPRGEMLAFFERHGLPTDAHEYGADQELKELASGLQREHSVVPGFGPELSSEPPPLPPRAVAESIDRMVGISSGPDFGAGAVSEVEELTGAHALARQRPSSGWRRLGVVALVAGLGLMAAFFLNYRRASTLERGLEQAHMQQRTTDGAVTKLEQRAEALQAALRRSEDERTVLNQRFEAILAEEAKKRATEELTLERVLGPRYSKLRRKLAAEVTAATP